MTAKKPRLNDLYREIARVAAIYTSDDGFCSTYRKDPVTKKEELTPVTIKGKRLVLVTDNQLANPDWEHRVAFHPLYESVSRGESDVHAGFRTYLNVHLNRVFGLLAARLLQLAASKTEHEKLTPDQTEYLDLVKEADAKTVEPFANILSSFPGDRAFVNIFVKPSGLVKGEKFTRAAIVTFPIYDALMEAEKVKTGVAVKVPGGDKPIVIRNKDRDTMIALLKYIIPDIGTPKAYDTGSLSKLAPTMDALMNAAAKLIDPLNTLLDLFKNQLIKEDQGIMEEDWNRLKFPTDWTLDFEDLSPLSFEIKSVPIMQSSEGTLAKAPEAAQQQQAPAPVPVPVPAAAAPAQPASNGRAPFPPPSNQGGYTPGGGYQSNQGYRPEPASPVKPNGKLDFDAVARNAPRTNTGYASNQPQQRTPGWARGGSGGYQGGGNQGGYYGGGGKGF